MIGRLTLKLLWWRHCKSIFLKVGVHTFVHFIWEDLREKLEGFAVAEVLLSCKWEYTRVWCSKFVLWHDDWEWNKVVLEKGWLGKIYGLRKMTNESFGATDNVKCSVTMLKREEGCFSLQILKSFISFQLRCKGDRGSPCVVHAVDSMFRYDWGKLRLHLEEAISFWWNASHCVKELAGTC